MTEHAFEESGRIERVAAAMETFLAGEVAEGPFRDLSRRLVAGALRQAELGISERGWTPSIDLPFDVCAATGADPAVATALAAACTFFFSGLDVIDDIADGDTQPQWEGVPAAEQTLAGLASLTSYPQTIIAGLPLPAEQIAAMQALLARRMLLACCGQQLDLSFAQAPEAPPQAVESAVIGKSGEQLALYCEWAALAAGAQQTVVETYGAFGRALGAAGQICSDLSEICHDEWCRDLASGNRTLPIAIHLERCGGERQAFLELLDCARTDRTAQRLVRQAVTASASLRLAAITAQVHFQRARRALAATGGAEPGLGRLRTMIDSFSVRKEQLRTT